MTKTELAKYAGEQIYALCTRPGGKFTDIHCLTVYRITERGTLNHVCEVMGCVANKAQYSEIFKLTNGYYVMGRPTAAKISKGIIGKLIQG